ncbi:MAG: beta-ketoacyl synthase chain length factor [Bacteroidales bacterium]|jgi:hypothetical protein|nr:beta-ketoacyl synthase chain length factor [Bacteroidales bacterium]
MASNVYIKAVKQISAQQPLCEEWLEHPITYTEPYIGSVEPDYKLFFAPNEARRLGKILRRALLVSRQTMKETDIHNPEAIITGTGLGCIENTEFFLKDLVNEGEELLKPTYFMQSTHNTISSLIAIDAKCNGYNTTYSNKGISFECALLDAFLQMNGGKLHSALVGAYDEMTPDYFTLLKRAGYLGKEGLCFAGETSVGMMLVDNSPQTALCRVENVEICYGKPDWEYLKQCLNFESVDAVMTGLNGEAANDGIYNRECAKWFPQKPLLHYKHLFGESYTSPAFAVYASAICLSRQYIPQHLFAKPETAFKDREIKRILCYNSFENRNHSFIILSICGR